MGHFHLQKRKKKSLKKGLPLKESKDNAMIHNFEKYRLKKFQIKALLPLSARNEIMKIVFSLEYPTQYTYVHV